MFYCTSTSFRVPLYTEILFALHGGEWTLEICLLQLGQLYPVPWGCDVYNDLTDANVTLHCPVLTDWTEKSTVDVLLQHEDITVWIVDQEDESYLMRKCKQGCPDAFL